MNNQETIQEAIFRVTKAAAPAGIPTRKLSELLRREGFEVDTQRLASIIGTMTRKDKWVHQGFITRERRGEARRNHQRREVAWIQPGPIPQVEKSRARI